jgi:hypothetical protein
MVVSQVLSASYVTGQGWFPLIKFHSFFTIVMSRLLASFYEIKINP